jgi:hypothetical protein
VKDGTGQQCLPLYTANPGDFRGAETFVELVAMQGRPDDL